MEAEERRISASIARITERDLRRLEAKMDDAELRRQGPEAKARPAVGRTALSLRVRQPESRGVGHGLQGRLTSAPPMWAVPRLLRRPCPA